MSGRSRRQLLPPRKGRRRGVHARGPRRSCCCSHRRRRPAIANARAYRDEQRARADLEALVETSPVGVVVFDTATGRMVSLNREAKRIVGRLRQPGRSLEELLGLVTCRRGDGREIALDQLPLAQALDSAETVHAEEIVLSVPGGPSVTTLVNATPIHSTGRRPRIDGRHHAGHGAAAGDRADTLGVPRHGQPRAARAADLDQGLDGHRAGRIARARPRRDARVLPNHRRAGQPHARPHRRSARCGTHRHRHALGHSRALGGGGARGPGPEHVPQRRGAGTPSSSTLRRICLV